MELGEFKEQEEITDEDDYSDKEENQKKQKQNNKGDINFEQEMENSDIAELNNDKDIFKSKKLFVQFLSRDQSHMKSTRILQILVLGLI